MVNRKKNEYNENSHKLTVEAIENALFILMKDNDYADISVTDIIRKAGISRAAFYNNYKNKDDIINERLSSLILAAMEIMDYNNSIKDKALSIFSILSAHHEEFRFLIESGLDKQILDMANEMTVRDTMNFTEKMLTIFWNGAIYNAFVQLIIREEEYSVEDLLAFVEYLSSRIELPESIQA